MDNGNSLATVNELKEYNIKILNALLEEKISTVQYMNRTFDTSGNYPHTILMNGQYADLSLSGGFIWPSNFTWSDIDGVPVSMTAIQAVQFSSTLFTYTQLCYTAYNTHLWNINNLEILGGITYRDYNVTTGWPVYGFDYNDATASSLYNNSRKPQLTAICCGSNTVSYFSTTTAAWITARRFLFRGTANSGTPVAVKAIAYLSNTAYTGQVRLYDATNGVAICTSAAFNNNTAAIINLGTISNLSANEAVWEIQIKPSATAVTIYINSLNIYF